MAKLDIKDHINTIKCFEDRNTFVDRHMQVGNMPPHSQK